MHKMIRYARLGILALLVFPRLVPALISGSASAEEAATPKVRPAYIALGEFTVNLPTRNDQLSYAVISITVEAIPAAAADLRAIEPRLKELVMRRLMAMADRGVLQPNHTDLLAVKDALMSSLAELEPNSVKDVLIVRLLFG
jgi:flagellar basal body-associated protein FliL